MATAHWFSSMQFHERDDRGAAYSASPPAGAGGRRTLCSRLNPSSKCNHPRGIAFAFCVTFWSFGHDNPRHFMLTHKFFCQKCGMFIHGRYFHAATVNEFWFENSDQHCWSTIRQIVSMRHEAITLTKTVGVFAAICDLLPQEWCYVALRAK